MNVYSQIRRKWLWICLAFAILFMNVFSLANLTNKPGVWYDEGINIELARNFAEFGKLDLITEPLTFTGYGALIGSTGYPVTLPLALFFKIFGFGFAQARIYMLLWMNLALFAAFLFVKKRWGTGAAAAAVLLFVTFPPFYGNGRSVMGEIPGFVFMLWFLDWFLSGKKLWLAGIFLGLAVISKPSIFVFLIPATAILLALNRKDFIKKVFQLGAGSLIPFVVWVGIYADHAFSRNTWLNLKDHFANPYKEAGFSSAMNIKNNLLAFFQTPTLVYFLLLFVIIAAAGFLGREFFRRNRFFLILAGFYGLFSLFYFLKSLGYLRYLIAAQLLILIFLEPSLRVLENRFLPNKKIHLTAVILSLLILFQLGYLFTRAKLFYSSREERVFQYVERNFPESTVGVINIPPIASLIPPDKRFQTISSYGLRGVGENPLLREENRLPGVIILDSREPLEDKYVDILKRFYGLVAAIDGDTLIYKKN